MNTRLILTGLGALVAAYLAGRFSAPVRVKVETKTEFVERVVIQKVESEEKTKTITEVTRPNGTKLKRTRIESKRDSVLSASKDSQLKREEKKITEYRRGVSVSALVGVPLDNLAKGVVYGASLQKHFIGPLILGAWAFTDLRFGLSVGIEL